MSEVGQEKFDAKTGNARLHMVLDRACSVNIWDSSSAVHSCHSSYFSVRQSINAKRTERAAQLAAKQAKIEMGEAIATQRQELKGWKISELFK